MPFDNPSKRIQALYAFVDQYISGDAARRSQLDQFFNDLIASSNAGIAYLEGLTGSSTDQRYLGRSATVPTQRVNATALQAGDFYVSSAAPAGRVGLVHVYDGSAFVVDSDFLTVGAFFKDTLSAADTAAAARGALGLGDASVQNASAFAAASVATDVALAIKILANGIAKNLTDWNTAHSVGPGSSFVQGNAAATNGPVAENISGVYTAYDANNGFILASAHVTGMIYFRARSAATWGAWVNMSPGVSSVTAVLLTDAAATLTATQLVANKLFTITPTVGRILTTATGTQIATAMSGAPVGTSVAFTIVNRAPFSVTLAAGVGVTIIGGAMINNGSGTWRIRVDSPSAVTIYTEAAIINTARRVVISSPVATVNISLPANFKRHRITIIDWKPVTDDVSLRLRVSTDGGITFNVGATDYHYNGYTVDNTILNNAGSVGATFLALCSTAASEGVGNAAAEWISGTIEILNAADPGKHTSFEARTHWDRLDGTPGSSVLQGKRKAAQDTDTIRLFFNTGNIASGEYVIESFVE